MFHNYPRPLRGLSVFLTVFLPLFSASFSQAQIAVTPSLTANQLAQILAGPGVAVSNATITGLASAAGSFTGTSNIGFNNGIILTTGAAGVCIGPNNTGSASQDLPTPGIPELNAQAGAATQDGFILEFDFVPQSNLINFRYVFGSEEYPEFVNTGFNDAFAFYISGPGIAGQQNLAIIPGTANTPVTIDNVNGSSFSQYYVNNAGGATIQFDGFTTVLTATRAVQACQTYHLRIMIADAGDGLWESGVFLEAGSLSAGNVTIQATTLTADNTAYEGCSAGTVTFTLGQALAQPYTLTYTLQGTAINGTDYTLLPGSITIPAGQTQASFLIDAQVDGVNDGIETVYVVVQTTACANDTVFILINDVAPLQVQAFGDTSLCGGPVPLWASGTGGAPPYTYTWNNGGGVGDTVTVNPANTTVYTVTMTDFCNLTPAVDQATVTVDPIPVANAGPDINYCAGNAVLVTGTGGNSYAWYLMPAATFVANGANLLANPVGQEDYMMIATIGGCSDTDYVSLFELPAVVADAGADSSICSGDAVQLTASGGAQYLWNNSLSLDNPNIATPFASPSTTTIFTVTVTDANGCVGTDDATVTILPSPTPNAGPDQSICDGSTTTLSGFGGATYNWVPPMDLDDPTLATPTFSGTSTTIFTLTVTAANGCSATDDMVLTVSPLPVVNAGADQTICQGGTAQMNAVGNGNFSWSPAADFSNPNIQNPVATPAATTMYYALLTNASGCQQTDSMLVTVMPRPTASFVPPIDDCIGTVMQFTDASVGTIVQYDYSLGDGNGSAVADPTHTYAQYGLFAVNLEVTTDMGCVDDTTINVTVFPKPTADFTYTGACLMQPNYFYDQSVTLAGSNIVQWEWDFGAGVASFNPVTQAVLPTTGIHNITLMIETDQGCRDTVSQTVEVYVLPVADFDVTNVCFGTAAVFGQQSSIPSGSINLHQWSFGNGNSSYMANPPGQNYNSVGTFPVTLIVTSNFGCSDTLTQNQEIFPIPTADFSVPNVCHGEPTVFTDLSNPNGSYAISEWTWDFGDGTNSQGQAMQHTYTTPGYYTVSLDLLSGVGCTASVDYGPVVVYPNPVAAFADDFANCLNLTTSIVDASTVQATGADSITVWSWTYGDGGISALEADTHTYAAPGLYPVTLIVQTNNLCSDTVSHTIEIYPLPVVDFVADTLEGCQPFRVQFTDQSSIAQPYGLANWYWDFGDGNGVTAQFPSNNFEDRNLGPFDLQSFTVTLQVTSANGCTSIDSIVDYITVHPKPDAQFTADKWISDILDPTIRFTDQSSANVTQWHWSFGDGTSAVIENPSHTYLDTISYLVTQTVTTDFGCVDTTQARIDIKPVFTFWVPEAFTPNADGYNEVFNGQGTGVAQFQLFIYNRWGQVIFESYQKERGWDGTVNGEMVQQGAYVYVFKLMDVLGEPHVIKGNVKLFR